MTRWVRRLGLVLMVALAVGCASRSAKPTAADDAVAAATRVLAAMADGYRARDVSALAGLWAPAQRDAARERLRAALGTQGPAGLRLTLVGLRLEGGRRVAQVSWRGRWGAEPVAGGFEMELSGDDPPRIVAIRGEDPMGGNAAPDLGGLPPAAP